MIWGNTDRHAFSLKHCGILLSTVAKLSVKLISVEEEMSWTQEVTEEPLSALWPQLGGYTNWHLVCIEQPNYCIS